MSTFHVTQHKSRNGCIDVSAATAIGGSELYRCGIDALAGQPRVHAEAENIMQRPAERLAGQILCRLDARIFVHQDFHARSGRLIESTG